MKHKNALGVTLVSVVAAGSIGYGVQSHESAAEPDDYYIGEATVNYDTAQKIIKQSDELLESQSQALAELAVTKHTWVSSLGFDITHSDSPKMLGSCSLGYLEGKKYAGIKANTGIDVYGTVTVHTSSSAPASYVVGMVDGHAMGNNARCTLGEIVILR